MSDETVLECLCEEIVFWHEYIYQKEAENSIIDERMYRALDFARQRLGAYLNSDKKDECEAFLTAKTTQNRFDAIKK